jgi:hypothetical protein
MIDQGTYRSSACPYECSRKVTRHEVVPSNEANMLSGIGLIGEGFIYPGHADSNSGFSRFSSSGSSATAKLHPLHMSHNVTLDQCDDIVNRHQLLAPHGVWLVHEAHEDDFASAERLGDCGLFLGARSSVDADIWRAFYRYARLVLRLGHVDTWLDDDMVDAIVHSSSEKACKSATSKVCLWWSEFDLDEEEYSCRPKRDASNIITPAILLATLAANDVSYPPPNPPPPQPPTPPPSPTPPPGAIRCELSGIASTRGYKIPMVDTSKTPPEYTLVQQKCWHWDAANDWPPFVAHRDLYVERDRCSGARSRDVQWDGGFKQSLLAEGAFDPNDQNTNDCPYKSMVASCCSAQYPDLIDRMEDGANCMDAEAPGKAQAGVAAVCDLGTNLESCGIRKNLVVFGFANLLGFQKQAGTDTPVIEQGIDQIYQGSCISKVGTDEGKWVYPTSSVTGSTGTNLNCLDGGPGSIGNECYYGTHSVCGKRRFAFKLEDAGPDIPDNSCPGIDSDGWSWINNGFCDDGLMWSRYAPGKNPCAPNTDVTDCGYRPTKRPTRVGQAIAKDDCEYTGIRDGANAECIDYSDDLFHGKDIDSSGSQGLKECGRGTQTQGCQAAADAEVFLRVGSAFMSEISYAADESFHNTGENQGTIAYVSHRYHEKVAYINPNLAGKGQCVSPTNLLHVGGALVRLNVESQTSINNQWKLYDELATGALRPDPVSLSNGIPTTWFGSQAASLETSLRDWPKAICSDGGEGSFRIPFHFGAAPVYGSDVPDATASTKFFYDFGCPYGSQQGVCPDREGLDQYQKTLDELEQPSGPAFSNCFDVDVPDFECCRAETSFRIHGQGGKVGNTGSEQLEYCAMEDNSGADPDYLNLNAYSATTNYGVNSHQATRIFVTLSDGSLSAGMATTLTACMGRCDQITGRVGTASGMGDATDIRPCLSFVFEPLTGMCYLLAHNKAEYDADNGAVPVITQVYSSAAVLYLLAIDPSNGHQIPYETPGINDPCPLHWTSYHHTPTGCKDFCAAAFGRIGDDNTCMPGKPECANWLDSDDFPTEYVTVNAECICGAKLEDLQDSGKYVHTGTVLQDTRARARRVLHEDAAKDNDNDRWSWPDSVMAGIDQIHGNHFDAGDACVAEIMSFRTDLLNNSRCDDYLTMGAPPMDEWDPTNTSGHELCADDGSNDDACCVVNRGEAQASRVWRQMGDMTTSSVDQAFGISSIVGTAVHTSRVAAVGNFVSGAASLKP